MLQMFYVTLWGKTAESWDDEEVLDNLYALSDSPVLLGELQALLQYQYDRIDFIDEPVDVGFDCPLDLHCTYTRDQLLVALDFLKPATVREGVKWLPEKQLDVFFVTLNKADKDYSPTTMYKDYSINESLFHWQSQSTTAENSATGQRYIHHRAKGSRVLLFVREFKADARFGGAGAYTYLVLEHCSIESTAEYLKSLPRNKKAERYSRAGTAWSQKEERELLRLHQQGNSIKRISLILKRSTGAIESKLRKLGCPLYYEK